MEITTNKPKLNYDGFNDVIVDSNTNLNILPVEIIKYINSFIHGYLDNTTIRIVIRDWFNYLKYEDNEHCKTKYIQTVFRYGKIEDWNTSKVTNMRGLFAQFPYFSNVISGWDVSSVQDMSYMFEGSKFNQDLSNWDVSNVVDMHSMFEGAEINTFYPQHQNRNILKISCPKKLMFCKWLIFAKHQFL